MNTKMILEVAGAKPLAEQANAAGNGGKAGKVKGLVVEKRPVALRENFTSFGRTAAGGLVFPKRAQPTNADVGAGEAVPGLGMEMWRGVFG